jgi:hypothetical protein
MLEMLEEVMSTMARTHRVFELLIIWDYNFWRTLKRREFDIEIKFNFELAGTS